MQENSALGRAVAMVRDLRQRCPWDRVQTRETIRPYLVEEVFELDHAIAEGDPASIREEVADLLLHLGWQLVLGEERGEFTADQVADDLEHKMKRRHPHLFDLGPAEKWANLKRREKRRGVLDGLPPALPSLLMAYRLQERAAGVGFDWPDTAGPLEKVREELGEVEGELRREGGKAGERESGNAGERESGRAGERESGKAGERESGAERRLGGEAASESERGTEPVAVAPSEELVDEIGDLLFAVVNLARKAHVQPTTALDRANNKFKTRFEKIEKLASERGIDMATAGLEKLDELWDEVKRNG